LPGITANGFNEVFDAFIAILLAERRVRHMLGAWASMISSIRALMAPPTAGGL
jgi:hypothetical protein